MGKKHEAIVRSEIIYKGQFTMEMLYKVMFFWLKNNNYVDIYEGTLDKYETRFFERIQGNGNKEVWYFWRAKKEESSSYTYNILLDVHILNMASKEIIVDGRKTKTNTLEISIVYQANVEEADHLDLTKNGFTRALSPILGTRRDRPELEQKKKELYLKVNELMNVVKQFLGAMQHSEVANYMHNPKGVPQFS